MHLEGLICKDGAASDDFGSLVLGVKIKKSSLVVETAGFGLVSAEVERVRV